MAKIKPGMAKAFADIIGQLAEIAKAEEEAPMIEIDFDLTISLPPGATMVLLDGDDVLEEESAYSKTTGRHRVLIQISPEFLPPLPDGFAWRETSSGTKAHATAIEDVDAYYEEGKTLCGRTLARPHEIESEPDHCSWCVAVLRSDARKEAASRE